MLTETDARRIAHEAIPEGRIETIVAYRDLYLLQIFIDEDAEEGQMDPFYSVNQQTGELRDFSIINDGDITEITSLFLAAKGIT